MALIRAAARLLGTVLLWVAVLGGIRLALFGPFIGGLWAGFVCLFLGIVWFWVFKGLSNQLSLWGKKTPLPPWAQNLLNNKASESK